jgi:hypothetical protein
MLRMGLPSTAPRMEPENSMDDQKDLPRPNPVPALEEYEALPPVPAPRGMMKPKLKIYHWILIALLLGGFVALMLVGLASD